MMSDYKDFFKDDPWSELSDPAYPSGRQLYVNDDRFWVSRNESGQILFFIHEKEVVNVRAIENLAGVELEVSDFNGHSSRLICTLTVDEDQLKDKFAIVAKDVAYHCSQYSGVQLFLKVQERIKSWAQFLKPVSSGLSHAEFVGLWGELYAVSEVLMDSVPARDAVRFWVGPDGKKQDITLNTMAIEVKTSLSGDPKVIKISSLDQLDKSGDELYLLRVVASPCGEEVGLSLKDLYERCLGEISGDGASEALFLQKISQLYGKADKFQLNDAFLLSSLSMYRVGEGFPSLTSQKVPAGVVRAMYDISISSISDFEVSEDIKGIISNG